MQKASAKKNLPTAPLLRLDRFSEWLAAQIMHVGPYAASPTSTSPGPGMGELQLARTMPSGHRGVLMPQRMYSVESSTATLGGVDLGRPTHVEPNPTIGDVPLPVRGVLAIVQAMWEILDPAEYERTSGETPASPARDATTT